MILIFVGICCILLSVSALRNPFRIVFGGQMLIGEITGYTQEEDGRTYHYNVRFACNDCTLTLPSLQPVTGRRQTVPNQNLGRIVTVYYNEAIPDCVWIQGFCESLFPACLMLCAGICLVFLGIVAL